MLSSPRPVAGPPPPPPWVAGCTQLCDDPSRPQQPALFPRPRFCRPPARVSSANFTSGDLILVACVQRGSESASARRAPREPFPGRQGHPVPSAGFPSQHAGTRRAAYPGRVRPCRPPPPISPRTRWETRYLPLPVSSLGDGGGPGGLWKLISTPTSTEKFPPAAQRHAGQLCQDTGKPMT